MIQLSYLRRTRGLQTQWFLLYIALIMDQLQRSRGFRAIRCIPNSGPKRFLWERIPSVTVLFLLKAAARLLRFCGKVETVNYLTTVDAAQRVAEAGQGEPAAVENKRQAEELAVLAHQVGAQRASFGERLSALEHMIAAHGRFPTLAAAIGG